VPNGKNERIPISATEHRGHNVVAIDNSPFAVEVAKLRGVKAARVLAIRDLQALIIRFNTIMLYGNNFGLFGGITQARRLPTMMHRITESDATIIAEATDPYKTNDPVHLAYQ
jgi:hypothetical protein